MTAKEFVLQEYPKAWAYRAEDCWIILDNLHPIGCGHDKSSAWTNAKQNIKEQDTSIHPDE